MKRIVFTTPEKLPEVTQAEIQGKVYVDLQSGSVAFDLLRSAGTWYHTDGIGLGGSEPLLDPVSGEPLLEIIERTILAKLVEKGLVPDGVISDKAVP